MNDICMCMMQHILYQYIMAALDVAHTDIVDKSNFKKPALAALKIA